jgi:hypothetical protein
MRNRNLLIAMAISFAVAAAVPAGAQMDGAAAIAPVAPATEPAVPVASAEPEPSLTLTPPEGLVAPYDYRFTREDRLLAAQACVHEATWAGATHTGDCGGIIQVVMERRRPTRYRDGHRFPAETFEHALARTMPRFYAGRTTRSWTRFLTAGPLRIDPPGWPYAYPARHHDESWLATNQRVAGYMRGSEPLPCSPTPGRWFGRETDGAALASTLAEGRWCEAICGESRNAFLTRCAALAAASAASPEVAPEE